MYLGMLIILLSISFKFNFLGGIIISLSFFIFITKFQIYPEEEAMNELFGDNLLNILIQLEDGFNYFRITS